jgi:hypothetical protein
MLRQGLPAIRLPPLSFPKGRPPHRGRAPERSHRVSSRPLRGRIPSAGPRPSWDGSLLGLASDCLGRVVPSRQTSTDPNRARRAGAGESSGTSGPAVDRRACLGDGPLPVLPYVGSSRPRRGATGQRPCDHGTGSRAVQLRGPRDPTRPVGTPLPGVQRVALVGGRSSGRD